jgi:hypothetical protein
MILLVPLLGLAGCATAFDGWKQTIAVKTMSADRYVEGATCTLSNGSGTWTVQTPGFVTVHRSYDDLNIKCEHDGYIANVGAVPSDTKDLTYGNIVAGGLIGAGVDVGSGSAYDYPSLITVVLQPVKTTAIEGARGT